MKSDDEHIDDEERWSIGTAIGEAVWLRLCAAAGWDAKDERLRAPWSAVVDTVRGAYLSVEGEGLDGLAEWLDLEKMFEDVK